MYLDVLSEAALEAEKEIWGYCLMPNHVHLIAMPALADPADSGLAPGAHTALP
ncbi:hypothetical protein ABC977_13635 [Thioalkalicoccus limnaeus]|uniref:Transposase IS200-like domain-containing protein n=1 Tax=Thioalkalicoccus limnaeus TaxID=120681 RepID=A0ABV4BFY1_9GAMM